MTKLLDLDPDLQPVVEKAREINALARLCQRFLPPELAAHVRAANLKDGRLVILAAHPAAAAKLKLLSNSLCEFLSKERGKVNSVSIRVQPEIPSGTRAATQQKRRLSPPTLADLRALHARMAPSPARDALGALLARHATRARSDEDQ